MLDETTKAFVQTVTRWTLILNEMLIIVLSQTVISHCNTGLKEKYVEN